MKETHITNKTTKITSVVIIAVATWVLIGWISGSPEFRKGVPGIFNFKFSTALCFLLSGVSLFLLDSQSIKKRWKITGNILAVLVLLISVFILTEHIFNFDSGLSSIFLKSEDLTENRFPGKMYLLTSIIFILSSSVLLLLHKPKSHQFIHVIIITVIVFMAFNFLVNIARINYSNFSLYIGTAFNTSFAFLILYVGVFYSAQLRHLKFTFEKQIAGYFSLVALVLIIVFYAININNQRSKDTAQWIQYSNDVLLKNQRFFNLEQNMGASARGYMVSENSLFLESFNKSISAIHQTIDELKKLIQKNSLQRSRIDSLSELVESNIVLRRHLIELRKSEGYDAANQFFGTGIIQKNMEELRRISDNIEMDENALLSKQKSEHAASLRDTYRITFLFQFIIILLLVVAFIVIYKNTQARNKTKAEIKKNNLFLQTILENIPNMIFVKASDDLRFININKAGEKQLGVLREELIGKNDYDLFSKEIADSFVNVDKEVIGKKELLNIPEEKIITSKGERWLHTQKIPVIDENGKPLYLLGISEDITEKKIANDELKKATEQVFDLYNNAPCGYHSLDSKGVFVDINDTELNWLGYKREDVIGKLRIVDIIAPESMGHFLQIVEDFQNTGVVGDIMLDLLRKDGTIFPGMISTIAFNDENGNHLKSRSTVFDYTERKVLDDQIQLFNESLEKKVTEKTAELKASNVELERFAYVASHDLQEPLRMVSSFLQLLEKKLEGTLDETNKKYIDFAIDGAERMKRLIQDLLEYSRLGTSKEGFKNVDCNEILQTVSTVYQSRIEETKARLHVKPLPVIHGRQTRIQQLFQNLVGNALKYHSDQLPEIEIGCTELEGYWQFYVKDNGIGIEPKFFDKIFIIFQRLHNKTEYSGTGIGLSICKKIVERHGGRIWVESEYRKGSTFYFTIQKNIL